MSRFNVFNAVLAFLICTSLTASGQDVRDNSITGERGVASEPICPGGPCGDRPLGVGLEGVTSGEGRLSFPEILVPCTGADCGVLPENGDLGGITRDDAEPIVAEKPSFDEGINLVTQGRGEKAAAGAGSLCGGNNFANDDFVDSIMMGGPVVGVEWIPSSSITVTGIEVFTGEHAGPSALALWSDNGGSPGQPLAALGFTSTFTTSTTNGWQGAALNAPVSVTAGARYWVVWDPDGGEQAAVNDDPSDIQQPYWGSFTGDVTGGTSWFGPFTSPNHRWKFRMTCADGPCDGNNFSNDNHLDNVSMGNVLVSVAWVPSVTADVERLEVYTGEVAGSNAIGLWSDGGGTPLAPLGFSNNYTTAVAKGWQGADLISPVSVVAGQLYWVVWETAGGEQAPVEDDPAAIQQTYWGSSAGTVTGGASWFGPFSFTDRRWKFRAFCEDGPCDGNNFTDSDHLDPVLMGGPMVGIEWTPTTSNVIRGIEVFTGEHVGPNALALWSDNGGIPGQPLANLGNTGSFNTTLAKGWQGGTLGSAVAVSAGTTYWVVWDPDGGEQAAVNNDPSDTQQTYWGSFTGNVTGGASWFGPFSFSDRRWKFRFMCEGPCDGHNFANENHLDNVLMGGPMVGIEWDSSVTNAITRVEVYTGEHSGPNAVAIWSSNGTQPLAPLGFSGPFTTNLAKDWQGADLLSPAPVTAGSTYWVVWDPDGGEQSSLNGDPGDIQQTYWGTLSGNVAGGASWFGPFSFSDRRWKFKLYCRKTKNRDHAGWLDEKAMGQVLIDPSCYGPREQYPRL